jgi:hypothetical protein
MNAILEKLMSFLPTVEAGDTEAIALATELKTALQAAQLWQESHEDVFQAAVEAAAPAVPVGTPPAPPAP